MLCDQEVNGCWRKEEEEEDESKLSGKSQALWNFLGKRASEMLGKSGVTRRATVKRRSTLSSYMNYEYQTQSCLVCAPAVPILEPSLCFMAS